MYFMYTHAHTHTHKNSALYIPSKWELLAIMMQIKLKLYILEEILKGHVFKLNFYFQ